MLNVQSKVQSKIQGFTLVEVLIAAVILFSALAITADLYKASSFSSNKVTEKSIYFQQTGQVISSIKASIYQQTKAQKLPTIEGQLVSNHIEYRWRAERISFKPRPMSIEEVVPPPPQFGLYQVEVIATGAGQTTLPMTFKVATW